MRIRIIAAAALAAAAAVAAVPAAPAQAAAPPAPVQTGATATCNTEAGTWDVTWTIRNNLGGPALTILLASTPEGLGTLPSLPAAGAVEVTQSVDGTSAGAHLEFIAVWYAQWPTQSWKSTGDWVAPGTCAKA
ncbi:hypothetical protein [Spirilliplanes yamanashiensis]|uniref:Uncharacterized protein n=1 Tax=Spirilliplanes yamanashiensis TaxID=42233 RepID=A0A8J3YB90_9ACTN|nr:hypothetical protein [Spirilliplanes yamanashiensis]MDP9817908.1 hypothetical protein [Spirilliplanes yamanashiensis]GIJ04717.1 hypothetical protein Sya03_40690 [Spirilliplanes yamanashiensis]